MKKQHRINFAFKLEKNREHLQKLFLDILTYIQTYWVLRKSCFTYIVINNNIVNIVQHYEYQ